MVPLKAAFCGSYGVQNPERALGLPQTISYDTVLTMRQGSGLSWGLALTALACFEISSLPKTDPEAGSLYTEGV